MNIKPKTRNRDNIRRYMARKRKQGWNKYCFLVPAAVAAEMYRLKEEFLSKYEGSFDGHSLFDNRAQRKQKRGSDLSVLVAGRGKARGNTSGSKVKQMQLRGGNRTTDGSDPIHGVASAG